MNNSEGPSQRYRPLPDGCIRLLSIKPSTSRTAQVECNLSPARVDERPYEALSYVWGSEDATQSIIVDEEHVLVRPNLHGALKELRLTDQSRNLWVDSICIDQSNVAERNQQVKQMGSIYSSATQVVIWLGEEDNGMGVALDLIQGLSKLDPDTARRINSNAELPWEHRQCVFDALGSRHGFDNYDELVGSLTRLRDDPWWTRIWTVQEIVLARSAILRCGPKSASWAHLGTLASFAFEVSHHNTLTLGRPMDETIFDEVTAHVSKLYIATLALNNFSQRVSEGLHINLESTVASQVLTRKATDPLDMIYALVGLLTDKSTIEIDYGKSKKQVYTRAMKVMLEQDYSNLHPLHFLQDCYLERDASLPSWVPDFGILHSFKTTNLRLSSVGTALTIRPLYNTSFGDAAQRIPPKFLGDNHDVLQIEGVTVDEVKDLGCVCPRFPNEWAQREAQLREVIDNWRKLVPKTEDEYVGGGSVMEGFWRTVTFDLLLIDRDYLAGNPDRRDWRLPKGAPGMPPTTPKEEAEIREGILDAPPPKTVLEKLGERRFFVTKSGYFGLGPAFTQPDDIVCVLRGAFFPIVVRPTVCHRYTIIGESFVHGIMDGEIMDSLSKGTSSRQVFTFV